MISEIQIIPVKPHNGLLAFSSFILDGAYYIGDIAIHSRPDGSLRAVFPNRILANGKRIPIFYPISREASQAIEQPVFQAYDKLTNHKM